MRTQSALSRSRRSGAPALGDHDPHRLGRVRCHDRRVTSLPPLHDELHVCTDCAVSYASVTVPDALQRIQQVPAEVESATRTVRMSNLRRRPDKTTWSVIEYACHLRDVYATYTVRLYRTRTEHRPVMEPMLNDLRVVRFRYIHRDLAPVLAELADNVAGITDEVARFSDEEWDRVATRLPAEQRSARWMIRQAMHEGTHHTRDIALVSQRLTSSNH